MDEATHRVMRSPRLGLCVCLDGLDAVQQGTPPPPPKTLYHPPGLRRATMGDSRFSEELPVLAAAKKPIHHLFFESLPKVNGCAGRAAMLCSREDPGKSQPKHGMCVRLPLEISARDASALLVGVTPV